MEDQSAPIRIMSMSPHWPEPCWPVGCGMVDVPDGGVGDVQATPQPTGHRYVICIFRRQSHWELAIESEMQHDGVKLRWVVGISTAV